jgi:hypothetical protein
MKPNQKLYVITRKDLTPGQMACQGMHAAIDFIFEFPEIAKEWHSISNHICFLQVTNEMDLKRFLETVKKNNLKFKLFYEPALEMQLTAVCLEPTDEAQITCSELFLAFS